MSATIAKTAVAPEMPESVVALLPKVRRKPLYLARNGKTAAVLMSAREYQRLAKLVNEMLEAEEDSYWAKIINESPDDEYLSVEESEKLLNRIANLKLKNAR